MSSDLVLLIFGAAIAGFVQGLSGFAFSMVAMSIWVWALDPRLAAVMAVSGSLTGQIVAAISVRRGLRFDTLMPYLAGGLAGIPIGVFVLPFLNPDIFRLVLGLMLIVWCPTMLFARHLPQIRSGGRIADGLAGLAGGVMGAIGGFSGVVPTIWCTLRGLEKDHQRAIIQNFNLATLTVTMATYIGTGVITKEMVSYLPVVAVAVLLPALLGIRIYARLDQEVFRKLVLVLLSFSGLAMLSASLPKMLS